MGLATLAVGLLVRLTVTYLVVAGQGFTVKERIFIALAWLPKATVQAAIGSIAYETAKEEKLGKEEELGKKLLTVSFLVIVVCAPVGAAAIQFSGPWLLRKESAESGINKKNGQVSQTITYQETNV
jgi:NhaP-type Na+/H+ or K+/H+ antiporter